MHGQPSGRPQTKEHAITAPPPYPSPADAAGLAASRLISIALWLYEQAEEELGCRVAEVAWIRKWYADGLVNLEEANG